MLLFSSFNRQASWDPKRTGHWLDLAQWTASGRAAWVASKAPRPCVFVKLGVRAAATVMGDEESSPMVLMSWYWRPMLKITLSVSGGKCTDRIKGNPSFKLVWNIPARWEKEEQLVYSKHLNGLILVKTLRVKLISYLSSDFMILS